MEIEGEQRKLIVDTGSNVSILQPRVSRMRISATPDRPYGVTGETLDVKGQQRVSFVLGGRRIGHEFLVCGLPTSADGLLGMDVLIRINAGLNLETGELVFSEDHEVPACNTVLGRRRALTVFCEQGSGCKSQAARVVEPSLARQPFDPP
jgi:hypothetical protein